MSLPALRNFADEAECKKYYIDNYCNKEICTHDGIKVKFHEDTFEHSFYIRAQKKWKSKKDHFSVERGERICIFITNRKISRRLCKIYCE